MSAVNWEHVARARLHPTQIRILDHLASGSGVDSPVRMHEEFGGHLSKVAYHVKALANAGILELAGTAQRRGAQEHFYKLAEGAKA